MNGEKPAENLNPEEPIIENVPDQKEERDLKDVEESLRVLSDLRKKINEETAQNPDLLENKEAQGLLQECEKPFKELMDFDLEEVSKKDAHTYFENHKKQAVYKNREEFKERVQNLYHTISEAKKDRDKKVPKKDIKLYAYIENAWDSLSDQEKTDFAKGKDPKGAKFNFILSLAKNRFKNIQLHCKKDNVENAVGAPVDDEKWERLEEKDEKFADSYIFDEQGISKKEIEFPKTDHERLKIEYFKTVSECMYFYTESMKGFKDSHNEKAAEYFADSLSRLRLQDFGPTKSRIEAMTPEQIEEEIGSLQEELEKDRALAEKFKQPRTEAPFSKIKEGIRQKEAERRVEERLDAEQAEKIEEYNSKSKVGKFYAWLQGRDPHSDPSMSMGLKEDETFLGETIKGVKKAWVDIKKHPWTYTAGGASSIMLIGGLAGIPFIGLPGVLGLAGATAYRAIRWGYGAYKKEEEKIRKEEYPMDVDELAKFSAPLLSTAPTPDVEPAGAPEIPEPPVIIIPQPEAPSEPEVEKPEPPVIIINPAPEAKPSTKPTEVVPKPEVSKPVEGIDQKQKLEEKIRELEERVKEARKKAKIDFSYDKVALLQKELEELRGDKDGKKGPGVEKKKDNPDQEKRATAKIDVVAEIKDVLRIGDSIEDENFTKKYIAGEFERLKKKYSPANREKLKPEELANFEKIRKALNRMRRFKREGEPIQDSIYDILKGK